jgi:signal transduction histidine kinase
VPNDIDMVPQTSRAWSGYAVVAGTVLIGLLVFWHALDEYGRPVPGVLVDPDLAVSSLMHPSWDGYEQGLQFPDRVVTAEGKDLGGQARRFDEVVEQARTGGRDRVRVEVRKGRGGQLREMELRFRPLDPWTWWLFAGGSILTGLLYVGTAGLAMGVRPDGRLARTFARAAVLLALFLFTLFDYHTGRKLVVVFEAAFAMVPFALVALALRLPRGFPWLERRPWLERIPMFAGILLAGGLVGARVLGQDTLGLRGVVSVTFGAGFLLSAVLFGVQLRRARGNDRLVMRALFLSMVPVTAFVGLAALLVMLGVLRVSPAFFAVPTLALIPLSSMVAFVRHDLWGSRALLSRLVARLVLTLGGASLAAAVACGIAVLIMPVAMRHAAVSAALGSALASAFVLAALVYADRKLFRSRVAYKPTVEQLSGELTAVTQREQVGSAVERTVRRWLSAESISFVCYDLPVTGAAEAGPDEHGHWSVPARFGGACLGLLRVGPKHGGALYSDQDLDLLRTIANLAAVALAHADRYAEVEQRRKQQAETWKTERAAVVETLAAEIAHEIRYPINFFRSLLRRNAKEIVLSAEEIDIGCEEVERLTGLVADLQRVAQRKLVPRWVPMLELVRRSETLLRDQLGGRRFRLAVPEELHVRCDADKVTQVIVNLMSNAIDAAPQGELGVSWEQGEEGSLVVWDNGEGFACDSATLFLPLFTTKATGTGLGLPIAHRLVRAHQWRIEVAREGGRTSFAVRIPRASVRNGAPEIDRDARGEDPVLEVTAS